MNRKLREEYIIGAGSHDNILMMQDFAEPYGESRSR